MTDLSTLLTLAMWLHIFLNASWSYNHTPHNQLIGELATIPVILLTALTYFYLAHHLPLSPRLFPFPTSIFSIPVPPYA